MKGRKVFGEVFEGKVVGGGIPQVTLRRLSDEEQMKTPCTNPNTIGIFHGADMIAMVDFDDLFDGEGNRFYND